MNVLARLAEFVHGFEPGTLTEADRGHLALHVLDSLGAMLAGSGTQEGRALFRVTRSRQGRGVDDAIRTWTATTRSTEMDDIHLASCTTPGSVIVPAALALEISAPQAFLGAVALGYEVVVRVGVAIEGPKVLGEGVWPTLFGAPLGAAAVASRALGLDAGATADALSTALAFSTGTSLPPKEEPTSRWLTLGAAAERGVLAARGAAEGLRGAPDLLEARGSTIAGVAVSGGLLLDDLGRRFRFREVGLKPYPVARQALAAVEACRALARDSGAPDEIERIAIAVPAAQRRVIDHPERPGAPERRMASIVNVRYLAALAVLAPEKLHDVDRSPPFTSAAIQELASRVEVETAPELERYYPDRWPARVEIRWKGKELSREVLAPAGDLESGYSWDEALDKFRRALAPRMSQERIEALSRGIRELDRARSWPFPELRQVLTVETGSLQEAPSGARRAR
jgi:2-methylcitrate dehydratase PrpD